MQKKKQLKLDTTFCEREREKEREGGDGQL